MRLYLAGPMRGYPLFNFPAFDAAAARLRENGYEVVSPAEMDRDLGFDPAVETLPDGFVEKALRRDLEAILDVDAIALLPGWQRSTGAQFERTVARTLGLVAYEYLPGAAGFSLRHAPDDDESFESVLEEADRIVAGDRHADYGHPLEDFTRTGRMWGAILGIDDVPAEKVGLCMVALKLSREVFRPKRDNRVDMAGYAKTVDMIAERRR